MKRQTGHPDMEALANFRAGLVEGIHGRRIAAHIASCERCEQFSDQLSAVTWALESVPTPAMPDVVEQRIGAAIAAEVAARRVASPAAGSVADPPAASPAPAGLAAAERRHARRWSPRRALGSVSPRLRLSPVQTLVPVAACLLLAGLGYLLSMPGPGAAGMPSSSEAAPTRSVPASENNPVSGGPRRDAISPTSAIGPAAGSRSAAFLVTVSTIQYWKSTLRAQVRSQLARQGPASDASLPSKSLIGCVTHLTRGFPPTLVQRATYQAEPAYVIAVPDQAWVVHLTCTATKPALITSVPLAPAG